MQTQNTRSIPGISSTAPSFDPRRLQIETKQSTMGIQRMVTALPDRWYTQDELLHHLGYDGNQVAASIFTNTAIQGRYVALEPDEFPDTNDPVKQFRHYEATTLELGEKAIRAMLDQDGVDVERIGCLVMLNSYGYLLPSTARQLIQRMNLPRHWATQNLSGTGCLGTVDTLFHASNFLAAHPDRLALVVTVEVASHYLRQKPADDKGAMVVNALMGDAAVATLVGHGAPAHGMPTVSDFFFRQDQNDTLYCVTVDMEADATMVGYLDRYLPQEAGKLFVPAIGDFLAEHGLTKEDINHWVFHPGSSGIMNTLQAGLDLQDEQLLRSRETLAQYGNCTGSTAYLALLNTMARSEVKPGDIGIIGALGPGLTVGLALLRWE